MRQLHELISGRCLYSPKPHRAPIGTADVYPIQKQHMKVDIQVQRTAETLDQGHSTSLCHGLRKTRFVRQVSGLTDLLLRVTCQVFALLTPFEPVIPAYGNMDITICYYIFFRVGKKF